MVKETHPGSAGGFSAVGVDGFPGEKAMGVASPQGSAEACIATAGGGHATASPLPCRRAVLRCLGEVTLLPSTPTSAFYWSFKYCFKQVMLLTFSLYNVGAIRVAKKSPAFAVLA